MSPEEQEEVWQLGTQRLAQLKEFLEQRLKVEHAQKVSSTAGIDEDEALANSALLPSQSFEHHALCLHVCKQDT
jgi:hypothetical protein